MTASTSRTAPASGATAELFDALRQRGNEPMLDKVSARVRFEVVDGERTDAWLLVIDEGELTVTRRKGRADCVIRGDRSVLDEVARGRANALAAVLRGALICEGDLELLFTIQRIFPDPPRGWDPTAHTRGAS